MAAIRELDFSAEVKPGAPAELHLAGNADIATLARFVVLLDELHAALLLQGEREVVVDLCALEFMSASVLNAIVEWLDKVQELPLERRYRLRFRSNDQILWQRRSLRTLSCFAVDLVTIE
ncbi:MAG: hypothetical protein ABI867_13215 [Kofleriaceae bacterium]